MASFHNLDDAFFDQWLLRSSFSATGEPWFSDAVMAQALTNSVSTADNSLSDLLSPVANSNTNTQSISVSRTGFGSDHETDSKMKRGALSVRIGKRKPRASKKSPTTFITADAANFRQMVQEVTGVKLPSTSIGRLSAAVKPEPQRIGAAVGGGSGLIYSCLPTLDTSTFLLDLHIRQQAVMNHTGGTDSQLPVEEIGGGGGGVAAGERDLISIASLAFQLQNRGK